MNYLFKYLNAIGYISTVIVCFAVIYYNYFFKYLNKKEIFSFFKKEIIFYIFISFILAFVWPITLPIIILLFIGQLIIYKI